MVMSVNKRFRTVPTRYERVRGHFSTCKRADYIFRTALHSPGFVERTMNSFDINERENERQRPLRGAESQSRA